MVKRSLRLGPDKVIHFSANPEGLLEAELHSKTEGIQTFEPEELKALYGSIVIAFTPLEMLKGKPKVEIRVDLGPYGGPSQIEFNLIPSTNKESMK